jgi:hypothetical protein
MSPADDFTSAHRIRCDGFGGSAGDLFVVIWLVSRTAASSADL